MSIKHFCDGSGREADPEKLIPMGYVIVRHYLPDSAKVAQEYLDERDKLHSEIASEWEKKFTALRTAYLTRLDSLPDYEPSG